MPLLTSLRYQSISITLPSHAEESSSCSRAISKATSKEPMFFQIENAKIEDAGAIAKVLLSAGWTNIMRLQLGTADPEVLNQGFEGRIKEAMQKESQAWLVARDDETGQIMSFAQWELPRAEDAACSEPDPGEQARQTEEYREKLPPGMNVALSRLPRQFINLRANALKGRRCYLLSNIATLPSFRGRGAAPALTSWPFADADKNGILVYLDTDETGNARRIYEKCGFRVVGQQSIDLEAYGGEGIHTHIAMCREPAESAAEESP